MRWLSTLALVVLVACDPWAAPGVYHAHSPGFYEINGGECGTWSGDAAYCLTGSVCVSEDDRRCLAEFDHCPEPYYVSDPFEADPAGIPCGVGVCLAGSVCDADQCVRKICVTWD